MLPLEPSSFACGNWEYYEEDRKHILRRRSSQEQEFPPHRKSASWPFWPERMPKRFPIEPHENDVLLGRGGRNNQHSGNEKLRNLARRHRDQYKTSSKREKSDLSRQLVRVMRELDPPARFLKRNQQSSEWIEVGDDAAREKTSQVLRDAVTGLLDKKSPSAPVPVATVSGSTDEHDLAATTSEMSMAFPSPSTASGVSEPLGVTSGVARLPSDDTYDDAPATRSYSLSPRKRRRRGVNPVSATHSFDERSMSSSSFDYSPIRRHHSADPRSRQRHSASGFVHEIESSKPPAQENPGAASAQRGHSRNVGSDYLGQLMQGDLLESDSDETDHISLMPRRT